MLSSCRWHLKTTDELRKVRVSKPFTRASHSHFHEITRFVVLSGLGFRGAELKSALDFWEQVVKELETKTSILQSSEDHLLKTMVNEQEGHRILKEDVRGKTKDLESLKEEIEVIKKTKRVLELRKDGNAEMSAEIKKSEDELLLLEKVLAHLHEYACMRI